MSVQQTPASTTPAVGTHNGTVTIRNPATGNHRTFRIRTETWKDGSVHRVVALLTGSDNTSNYTRFGFMNPNGSVNVWKRYVGTEYEIFAKMLLFQNYYTRVKGMEYLWSATCRKCNRKLTTPISIETGIGPVCGGRV